MIRKKTRKIMVGSTPVGGNSPITVQSMTNTKTKNVEETIAQILELEEAGCDIIRSAITDEEDAVSIKYIKENINIPFIADIQYDYRLALMAGENGADCLRLNPGNIGSRKNISKVVDLCKSKNIPIRVGVNSGSVKKEFFEKYKGVNEDSLVYSALEQIKILEDLGFYDIKISIKASDVDLSIKSYEKISSLVDYPLHIGITEAGPVGRGSIKSAVGIGSILSRGIGDTLRVSLTGDPIEEVILGRNILKSLGLLNDGIEIISCPTCGRTNIDLIPMVVEAEKRLKNINKNLKVAIMGCPVNGPGEAREADIGIAGGNGQGVIFKKGKVIKKLGEDYLLDELIKEIELM